MEFAFGLLSVLWAISGVIAHILQCREMKTDCGIPIWRSWETYLMFFPAMLSGPILFFLLEKYPERKIDQRHN